MDREVDINFHPKALSKFTRLKDRREAAFLKRKFYWLTDGDAKQFAEDYKKSESYRIIQELKSKHKTSEVEKPKECHIGCIGFGCDGSCN